MAQAILAQAILAQVGAWHQLGQKAHAAGVLTQAGCSDSVPRHGVLVVLFLTVFVSRMVHCRSAIGHWKHQQRSYYRGIARRPCVPTAYCPPVDNSGVVMSPPPPPPVFYGVELSTPRVRIDWNELCDECADVGTQTATGQPSSADFLATINKALQIIEKHCQNPRTISLDALVPSPACDAPPCVPTLKEKFCMPTSPLLVVPSAPLLVDAPLALKEVSYYQDYLPAATTEVATGNYYIGEEYIGEDIAYSADFAALEERFARLDTDHDLVILGNIQIEKRISALEKDVSPFDTLAEPGPCEADDKPPFNPAQLAALSKDINIAVLTHLDPLLDMIIAKVNFLTDSNVQNTIGPICKVLNCRLDVLEAVLRDECEDTGGPLAQGELIVNAIVQQKMRKYRFRQNRPIVHSSDKQSKDEPELIPCLHDSNLMQPDQFMQNADESELVHNSHDDSNLVQIDQLHIEDGPKLVRYFEKLVRDEVSSCNSAHELSDPKLKQSDQFNTGETLQDCIDFDELMNDFHSTAASAQLLRQSLQDHGTFGLQRDPSHLGFLANSSDQTVSYSHSQGASSLNK